MTGMDPGIAAFERMSALHWQGLDRERLGEWLLRAAGGFTGRANSALPLGDPGMPAERAVAEVEAWYSRRGLTPSIVIPCGLDAPAGALDDLLVRSGWSQRQIPVVVMTARSETVARHQRDVGMALAAEPDDDWLALYRFRGEPLPQNAVSVLLSAPEQVFASVRRDGRTIATAGCRWPTGGAGSPRSTSTPAAGRAWGRP